MVKVAFSTKNNSVLAHYSANRLSSIIQFLLHTKIDDIADNLLILCV